MPNLAPILFCILFVSTLAWVTLKGKEGWPLSCYPMFSHLRNVTDIDVFRLALETKEGKVIWWCPLFPRYQRRVGITLKKIYLSERQADDDLAAHLSQKQKYFEEVAGLIAREAGDLDQYQAFHIARRTVEIDSQAQLKIKEDWIDRIPIKQLCRGSCHV